MNYLQIDIDDPCHEDWERMTACSQGRHCNSCSKTVTDFTTWSDADLYRLFSKNPEHVCGRFLVSQLGRPIYLPPQPHSRLYRMVVAMGLTLMAVQGADVYAQARPPVAQQEPAARQKEGGASTGSGEITGVVLDDKKQPIIGAVVQAMVNGVEKNGAVTDIDGNYTIKPLEAGTYTIVVNYSGYEKWSREVTVAGEAVAEHIVLRPYLNPLKEVRVGGPKPLFNKRPEPKETEQPEEKAKIVPGENGPGRRTYRKEEIKSMPMR